MWLVDFHQAAHVTLYPDLYPLQAQSRYRRVLIDGLITHRDVRRNPSLYMRHAIPYSRYIPRQQPVDYTADPSLDV